MLPLPSKKKTGPILGVGEKKEERKRGKQLVTGGQNARVLGKEKRPTLAWVATREKPKPP